MSQTLKPFPTFLSRQWKPYPSYKRSGVEWLGEVPEHWEIRKLKFASPSSSEKLTEKPEELTYVGLENVESKTGRLLLEFPTENVDSIVSTFQPGDVLFGKLRPYLAKVFYSDFFGVCTSELMVLRPISKLIDSKYLSYLLLSDGFINLVHSTTYGAKMPRANPNDILDISICRPLLDEQKQIARFLDRETTRIDTLITKKRQLIDLLQKKRDVIVYQAITRGIKNGIQTVETKSFFFKSIPSDWKIIRLKFVVKSVLDGPHFSPPYVEPEEGIMFISARNVKVDGWSFDDAKYISEEYYREFCKRVIPQRGDILYTKGGTTGVARAVDFDTPFQVWVHIAILKVIKERMLPEYLAFALNSAGCYAQSQLYTRGATNNDLGLNRMVDIEFPLPSLKEQEEILDWLNRRVRKLDNAKRKIQSQLDLIENLRRSLITAVVTGKIDVREEVR